MFPFDYVESYTGDHHKMLIITLFFLLQLHMDYVLTVEVIPALLRRKSVTSTFGNVETQQKGRIF